MENAERPNADLADLLRELRGATRLTQEDLADRAGLGVRTIRQLESGVIRRPHRSTLDRVASGLGLDEPTLRRLRAAGNRADGRPATGAGAGTLAGVVPAQLPPAPTPFVGRAADLAALHAALGRPDADQPAGAPRIAVVTGPPGVGKSALALHWAHARRDRFPGGQLYLDLRGHLGDGALTGELAMHRVLLSLGVPAAHLPADPEALAAVYRSVLHGRDALLLLDNAGPGPLPAALLPGSTRITVVVTSRWRPDELATGHRLHLIDLAPLRPPDAHALLGHLVGAERLAAEPAEVAALVQRCSGFPLALRLVAAPLGSRPWLRVGQVAGAEGQAGPPDGMRGALDSSYRLLSEAAQSAVRLLAVHPGPTLTLDHAVVLTARPRAEIEATLDELCAAHLLDECALGRYRFHDVIAEYAHPGAAAAAVAMDRLLRFYSALTSAARWAIEPSRPVLDVDDPYGPPPGVILPRGREAALAWLDADWANLEPVVRTARADRPELAWRIARELATYAECRALWAEYLPIVRHGVAAAPDRLQAARMRLLLGVTLFSIGQVTSGAAQVAAAAEVFAEYDEPHLLGRALNNLGWARTRQGDHRGAVEAYRAALKIQAGRHDLAGAGRVLSNIGDAYVAMGELDRGLRYLRSALSVRRRHGTDRDVANALLNVGDWYATAGRPDTALPLLHESLGIARAGGDREAEGLCRLSLGRAYSALSDVDEAAGQLAAAAELRRATGNDFGEALALAHLAAVYATHHEPELARSVVDTVRLLCLRLPDADSRAQVETVLQATR